MRHYTALLILSLCYVGITACACVLAVWVPRELRRDIRHWRVRRELQAVKGER